MTDSFSRNLTLSLVAHAAVGALIFVKAVFVPTDPIEIPQAIRVDVVGLPPKMIEEMPPPAPEKPEAAAPAKPEPPAPPKPAEITKPEAPKVNLNKDAKSKAELKKAQQDALRKLKAREALEKINEELRKEKSAKSSGAIAGNQISKGNSLTGLDKIEYDKYFDDLKAKVFSNWNLPQWLADAPLKARVLLLIDDKGFIVKKIVRQSSGNEVFDAKVLEAIESSSPLPPPPPRLQGMLSTSGVILGFPER